MPTEKDTAELAYSVRRLSEIIESDSRRREGEYQDVTKRMEAHHRALIELKLLLQQILDKPPIDTQDLIHAVRKVVDELRQGLFLREMGISPWPRKEAEDTEENGVHHAHAPKETTKIVIPKAGIKVIVGEMTVGKIWALLKWLAVIVAAAGGVGLAIHNAIEAFTGKGG